METCVLQLYNLTLHINTAFIKVNQKLERKRKGNFENYISSIISWQGELLQTKKTYATVLWISKWQHISYRYAMMYCTQSTSYKCLHLSYLEIGRKLLWHYKVRNNQDCLDCSSEAGRSSWWRKSRDTFDRSWQVHCVRPR